VPSLVEEFGHENINIQWVDRKGERPSVALATEAFVIARIV
jgi:hypothetical protein